jgi:hypothetical protein
MPGSIQPLKVVLHRARNLANSIGIWIFITQIIHRNELILVTEAVRSNRLDAVKSLAVSCECL